jgi:short-subunit dehydrogenase
MVIALVILLSYISWRLYIKSQPLSVKDKTVVIVGASSGLGRSLALEYVKRGANVILLARRELELQKVVTECLATHSNIPRTREPSDDYIHIHDTATYIVCDITKEQDIKHAADTIRNMDRSIDILVLCTGIINVRRFQDIAQTLSITENMFKTNVFGFILCMKYFLDFLKESRGKVLVVGSLGGVMPAPTVLHNHPN